MAKEKDAMDDLKKKFLAQMIKGALEAKIITLEVLFKHVNADVLAESVPPELLTACIQEGMQRSGLAKKG
jgi:hypothetical protein